MTATPQVWMSHETKACLARLDDYVVHATKAGWVSSAEWATKAAAQIRREHDPNSAEARLKQIRQQYLHQPGDMTPEEQLRAIRHLATTAPVVGPRYERARAIAEAIANRWDKFGDSEGVGWLAEKIHHAIAVEAPPNDRDLCKCKIGQCHFLTERCREMMAASL